MTLEECVIDRKVQYMLLGKPVIAKIIRRDVDIPHFPLIIEVIATGVQTRIGPDSITPAEESSD